MRAPADGTGSRKHRSGGVWRRQVLVFQGLRTPEAAENLSFTRP
jgi:hypothetical protein